MDVVVGKSKLQKLVASSFTEAEYIVSCDVVKESIWLRGFLNEFGFMNVSSEFILIIKVSFILIRIMYIMIELNIWI